MAQENFEQMRKTMVASQLRTSDVNDPRIIAVMSDVSREDFVPAASRKLAYADRGVQIGEGRALNSPLSTGLLLNAAVLRPDDNVLLIGGATGYTAAVLSRLVRSVVAVEQSAKLVTRAKKALGEIKNVRLEKGALDKGFAKKAPYSVIMIDGVVSEVPQNLTDQLAEDGRLVAAIDDDGIARLALGRKGAGVIGYQYFADCGGAHLPGFDKAKSFQF